MSLQIIFQLQIVLGYAACLLCFGAYFWPRPESMNRLAVHRAIATLHSFRFFGFAVILAGVAGPNLPEGFATFAPTETSQPEYSPSWRFSRLGSVRSFGCSSLLLISWGRLTFSSTITTPPRSI